MKKITVEASKPYQVIVGSGLLKDSAELIRKVTGSSTVVIVTDETVDGFYSKTVEKSFDMAGMNSYKFVIRSGEHSKDLRTYGELINFMASKRITRADTVVALGGGVVGDLAGFAASTYLRGIGFVQIPTTFLACIDSSVGGKTGIDLTSGKNLVGAYYQPKIVLCDTDVLRTLPADVFSDGVAEAIKCGIISSKSLFAAFENLSYKLRLEDIIAECIRIKADIVKIDEFDIAERQFLNLGHTVGHAIEKCSGFTVTHGHAISIGIAGICRAAVKLNLLDAAVSNRIITALKNNKLPITSDYSIKELTDAALTDKKRRGQKITIILPKEIGKCILWDVGVEKIAQIISMGKE